MRVRYIRDFVNGSNVNNGCQYIEIKAVDYSGNNVALNKKVSSDKSINTGELSFITNGNTDASEYVGYQNTDGAGINITIDLGSTADVEFIQVWRFYRDGGKKFRGINLQVSEDNVKWISVFSTSKDGEYEESVEGKSIRLPIVAGLINSASLEMVIDRFELLGNSVSSNCDKLYDSLVGKGVNPSLISDRKLPTLVDNVGRVSTGMKFPAYTSNKFITMLLHKDTPHYQITDIRSLLIVNKNTIKTYCEGYYRTYDLNTNTYSNPVSIGFRPGLNCMDFIHDGTPYAGECGIGSENYVIVNGVTDTTETVQLLYNMSNHAKIYADRHVYFICGLDSCRINLDTKTSSAVLKTSSTSQYNRGIHLRDSRNIYHVGGGAERAAFAWYYNIDTNTYISKNTPLSIDSSMKYFYPVDLLYFKNKLLVIHTKSNNTGVPHYISEYNPNTDTYMELSTIDRGSANALTKSIVVDDEYLLSFTEKYMSNNDSYRFSEIYYSNINK